MLKPYCLPSRTHSGEVLAPPGVRRRVGLRAWGVTVTWNNVGLSLSSHTVDSIWGDDESDTSAGSLSVLVNAPASDTPANPLVQGADFPLLAARLAVGGGAAAGTYAVSAVVNSMINFGTNRFVEADAALARAHPDLPLVIGGHSHTYLNEPVRVGAARVVQAGDKATVLGRVDLWWDPEERRALVGPPNAVPRVPRPPPSTPR